MQNWLTRHWVVGAGFMAAALVALAPALVWPVAVSSTGGASAGGTSTGAMPLAIFLLFLHSPVYMIHQVEEHTGDRFRRFANQRLFHGLDAVSVPFVLVVNLLLVWGINLLALYAGVIWGAGWGLSAPYLMLVNALSHIGATYRFRCYNPGLVTGIFLFLPLSLLTLWAVGLSDGVIPHLLGLAVAVLLHLVLIGVVAVRYRWLAAPEAARR
ncbi:MAG TPA: HXXEE domain-containing protein [Rhodopila sp.]|uniref:HXXEE domain-containing protein n=1 Tax=Rhodopila sp. TaxID=2480087 RepID=UPI002BF47257|nr:HXXEE domain-containing protein [Rhodopila sp.]HVY14820.1 HXXEE domain-containing protein [Rhodopila sp.]